ncbi:PAS domain-containing protein [bacterium]|nr:PAS domain-containing protein [bacterium]
MNRKFSIFPNIDLTDQNKLILSGVIVSTIIIVALAVISIGNIQKKLYEGYSNFGQLLTKTLAIQTYELTRDMPPEMRNAILKTHSDSIIKTNKDISYLNFKDANGKVIYSTNKEYTSRLDGTKINISSPIKDSFGKVTGSVDIGLTADMARDVVKTTKNSMLFIFTLVWVVFTLVILANSILIARELTMLHHGVKEISSGKFGTMLDYSQASGEIKELFAAFNDMSKRLHAFEEQNIDTITLEKNKLESVLMSIANGVVVCDSFDKITIVNNAAQSILSATPSEIIDTRIQDYCDTNGVLCFKEKIALFKNTPLDIIEKKPLEFNVDVASNVIKTIVSPIYSKSHDYLGYILVLIDITKEAEVDKMKSDFISNVSHELRTPVTVLRTYADTLYNFGNEFSFDEQKEFIGTINQEVIRLNKMVNDILDFSKLQNDTKIEKKYNNIVSTIDETVNSLKVLADEKNIKISVIAEPNLPEVPYNEDSIERVLNNLITNAIKYSDNNSRIRIRAELSNQPDFIEISVEDFGMGIAKEHLGKIFDRFYRVENSSHSIKGTGLGLHLARVAIEKYHGGKIWATSELGKGSVFSFALPLVMNDDGDIIGENTYEIQPIEKSHREIVEDFVPKISKTSNEVVAPYRAKERTAQNELEGDKTLNKPLIKLDQEEVIDDNVDKISDWEISFEVREKA